MRKLVRNQSGQSVMEYIVLTGLIGVLCIVSIKTFGESLKSKIEQTTKKINQTITIR